MFRMAPDVERAVSSQKRRSGLLERKIQNKIRISLHRRWIPSTISCDDQKPENLVRSVGPTSGVQHHIFRRRGGPFQQKYHIESRRRQKCSYTTKLSRMPNSKPKLSSKHPLPCALVQQNSCQYDQKFHFAINSLNPHRL